MKAIDKIFQDGQELININPCDIDLDDRIRSIRGNQFQMYYFTFSIFILDAVQVKFGLTVAELTTVWIPMLECIKSKRRNLKAKVFKTTTTPTSLFQKQLKTGFYDFSFR